MRARDKMHSADLQEHFLGHLVAKMLNLEIPAKVLQRRSDMGAHLDTNADQVLGSMHTRRRIKPPKNVILHASAYSPRGVKLQ